MESKRLHLLQEMPKDCTPQEKLSPPCKEAGLEMPEHND